MMGMFDYVKCEHPATDGPVPPLPYQTKSFAWPDLSIYTIKADGSLWCEVSVGGRVGKIEGYIGEIVFYDGREYVYSAYFIDGKLQSLTRIPETDGE